MQNQINELNNLQSQQLRQKRFATQLATSKESERMHQNLQENPNKNGLVIDQMPDQ